MSLTLVSNSASLDWSQIEKDALVHEARVVADGGTVNDGKVVREMIANLYASNINRSRLWAYCDRNAGVKVSGSDIVKVYSVHGAIGDMTPVLTTGTATVGTSGGRTNCLIMNGNAVLVTAGNPLVAQCSTILCEARATNAALRVAMGVNDSTALTSASGPGTLQMGNTVGYRLNGYASGIAGDLDYATYADFQRMGFVTREYDTAEIFVDGTSVADKAQKHDSSAAYTSRYFRIGGGNSAVAVSRVLGYAGVLRPTQIKEL